MKLKLSFALLLAAVVAHGCLLAIRSEAQTVRSAGAGAVFVMTNSADKNEIIAYKRSRRWDVAGRPHFCN